MPRKNTSRKVSVRKSPSDGFVVTVRAVQPLLNTALNVCNFNYPLCLTSATGVSYTQLGSFIPRLNVSGTNMGGCYGRYRILRLKVTFIPVVASTSTGYVAVGVDPDGTTTPAGAIPNNASSAIIHRVSFQGDIKSRHSLNWRPVSAEDRRFRYCDPTLTSAANQDLSFGALQVYSSNDKASAAEIGQFMIEPTILFSGPI
jgi:hypothetical protein